MNSAPNKINVIRIDICYQMSAGSAVASDSSRIPLKQKGSKSKIKG